MYPASGRPGPDGPGVPGAPDTGTANDTGRGTMHREYSGAKEPTRPHPPYHYSHVSRPGVGAPPPARSWDGNGDDWGGGDEGSRRIVEPIMSVIQFLSMSTFVLAFIILLTGSMVDMMNMTRSAILYGFPPGFWFTLTLLSFFLWALTREWEGMTYGEANNLPWRSTGDESAAVEADVY